MNQIMRNGKFLRDAGLAGLCAFLALLTAGWANWIEMVCGIDVDAHNGAVEWTVVVALAAIGVIGAARAGVAWRGMRAH
jgi:hypothetical protein